MPRPLVALLSALSLAALGMHAGPGVAAGKALAVAVAPQYDSTHVYVAPEDFDRFTASLIATFGGSKSKQGVFQVTPTPSQTLSQLVLTPVGIFSVFGFKTPIPHPFGLERTGYLVSDIDAAVTSAREHGADVVVSIFPDAIGRDAIIRWPGGVYMQLYWHTVAPHYDALKTVPENRVYLSAVRADAFVKDFIAFSGGKIVSDDGHAPGIEIGRPKDQYRSVKLESDFGKVSVLVTDGHLPYPYGREVTGHEVDNLDEVLDRAKAAAVAILVPPYVSRGRKTAMVQFPGGFIAEIHSPESR